MTTLLAEQGSYAASGESFADRSSYLQALINSRRVVVPLGQTAVTHYEDEATLEQQMPFTD